MVTPPPRVYADSSVFGGAFDTEFAKSSNAFFDLVRQGEFQIVSSRVVEVELSTAPPAVQALFAEIVAIADVVRTRRKQWSFRGRILHAASLVQHR